MSNRKQLIEQILASLNAMKNKMHGKIVKGGRKSNITHSQWFALGIIECNKNIDVKEKILYPKGFDAFYIISAK